MPVEAGQIPGIFAERAKEQESGRKRETEFSLQLDSDVMVVDNRFLIIPRVVIYDGRKAISYDIVKQKGVRIIKQQHITEGIEGEIPQQPITTEEFNQKTVSGEDVLNPVYVVYGEKDMFRISFLGQDAAWERPGVGVKFRVESLDSMAVGSPMSGIHGVDLVGRMRQWYVEAKARRGFPTLRRG